MMPVEPEKSDPHKDREPPNWWVLVIVAAVFAAGLGLSLYSFMKRQRERGPGKPATSQASTVDRHTFWARPG